MATNLTKVLNIGGVNYTLGTDWEFVENKPTDTVTVTPGSSDTLALSGGSTPSLKKGTAEVTSFKSVNSFSQGSLPNYSLSGNGGSLSKVSATYYPGTLPSMSGNGGELPSLTLSGSALTSADIVTDVTGGAAANYSITGGSAAALATASATGYNEVKLTGSLSGGSCTLKASYVTSTATLTLSNNSVNPSVAINSLWFKPNTLQSLSGNGGSGISVTKKSLGWSAGTKPNYDFRPGTLPYWNDASGNKITSGPSVLLNGTTFTPASYSLAGDAGSLPSLSTETITWSKGSLPTLTGSHSTPTTLSATAFVPVSK